MTTSDFKNLLFLDIETVSKCKYFIELSPIEQILWQNKHEIDNFESHAALSAEFGKIISISLGMLYYPKNSEKLSINIKTFTGEEKDILIKLSEVLKKIPNPIIVTHGGKEFELSFICKRLVINKLALPTCLQISDKKPWEIKHQDTKELWKFGNLKDNVSLSLLATVLGVDYDNDTLINGTSIHHYFYDLDEMFLIKKNCEEKVKMLIGIYLVLLHQS